MLCCNLITFNMHACNHDLFIWYLQTSTSVSPAMVTVSRTVTTLRAVSTVSVTPGSLYTAMDSTATVRLNFKWCILLL